jgi:hypothetical protein
MSRVRKCAALLLGTTATLVPLFASAAPADAAANPGQPILDDYGQSPAEVAAEITAAVNATPSVIAARHAYAVDYAALIARQKAEAAARAAYLAAVKSGSAARIAATRTVYVADHAATVHASAVFVAERTAMTNLVNATTAAIRAKHYTPVDGVWTGDAAQYFIPGIGLEPVQVQITIYGGHVSDISVPVYTTTGDSAAYTAMSIPVLMQEAMNANDTATVANVTGASLTSEAFHNSLLSALLKGGFKY